MAERRFIDANEAMAIANECYPAFGRSLADLTDLRELFEDCTIYELKPVVHGRWKNLGLSVDGKRIYECTNCYSHIYGIGNFCKECGAQMDEKERLLKEGARF